VKIFDIVSSEVANMCFKETLYSYVLENIFDKSWESIKKELNLNNNFLILFFDAVFDSTEDVLVFLEEDSTDIRNTIVNDICDYWYKNYNIDENQLKIIFENNLKSLVSQEAIQNWMINFVQIVIQDDILFRAIVVMMLQGKVSNSDISKMNRTYPSYLTDVPLDCSNHYISRKELVNNYFEELCLAKKINIYAIGGLGKSELLKEFVNDIYNRKIKETNIEYIAWVPYINNDLLFSIQSAFHNDKLDWTSFIRLTENLNDKLIIIVDGIEREDPYFKKLGVVKSPIILSSRLHQISNFKTINLPLLDYENQKNLFYNIYTIDENEYDLKRILELTCGHTITIEMLARIAMFEEWNLNYLLNELIKHGFNLSEEKIKTSHERLTEDTIINHIVKLFQIVSYTTNEQIILTKISIIPDLPFSVKKAKLWDIVKTHSELHNLFLHGMLEKSDKEEKIHYWMHSIIAASIRKQYKKSLYIIAKPLLKEIANDLNTGSIYGYEYKKKSLISFGWSVYDFMENSLCDEHDIYFLWCLFNIVQSTGNYPLSLKLIKTAIRINNVILNDDDIRIENCRMLGDVLLEIDYFDECEKQYRNALIIAKQIKSNMIGILYHSLSKVYHMKREFNRAILNELRAITYEKKHNNNQDELATSYSQLGMIKLDMGYYEEALNYIETAINYNQLPKDNNETIMLMCYKANVLTELGYYEDAIELYNYILEFREKVFDKYNSILADDYQNYSIALLHFGNTKKALVYCDKAMDIYKINRSEDSIDYIKCLSVKGLICNDLDEWHEAIASYECIFDFCKQSNNIPSYDLGIYYINYADILKKHDKYFLEAKDNYEKGIELLEKCSGNYNDLLIEIYVKYFDHCQDYNLPDRYNYLDVIIKYSKDHEQKIEFMLYKAEKYIFDNNIQEAINYLYYIIDYMNETKVLYFEIACVLALLYNLTNEKEYYDKCLFYKNKLKNNEDKESIEYVLNDYFIK